MKMTGLSGYNAMFVQNLEQKIMETLSEKQAKWYGRLVITALSLFATLLGWLMSLVGDANTLLPNNSDSMVLTVLLTAGAIAVIGIFARPVASAIWFFLFGLFVTPTGEVAWILACIGALYWASAMVTCGGIVQYMYRGEWPSYMNNQSAGVGFGSILLFFLLVN
jgi:hypothetical protein